MDDKLFSLPSKLILEHKTRDPFKIAENLGIQVSFIDTKKQKGMCRNVLRNYFIWISLNLSPQMQRMTCAHELGHCMLHKPLLLNHQLLIEMEIFDIRNTTEYEANLFAANLLIDDHELLDYLRSGMNIVEIASSLDINVNMLAIKLLEMRKDGMSIRLPFIPERSFMGKIEDRADSI